MIDEHADRLDGIIDRLLELEPAARRAYIEEEFTDEPALSSELLQLVQANEATEAALSAAARAAERLLERTPDESEADLPPPLPTHIGPYEILDRLGAGGMGTVYLARQRSGELDREVALKVINHAGDLAHVQRRFRAERRILSRLEHTNVARLYDAGIDDLGTPYFVMELVAGKPVDRYADEGRQTVTERLALVRQLTDALMYAHRNLVVHRDIKPSNILVTEDGTVKLLDFGVAKLLDPEGTEASAPLTRLGAPALTPEYASPEQIRGEPVTTAADVYATGVLLYELLTGVRPYEFTSRSPVHIESIVSGQVPERPSSVVAKGGDLVAANRSSTAAKLARTLATDLDWIILKSLRKEPSDRYGSIQELASDLDRYLAHEPIEARPPTLLYRARKAASRHRTALIGATLVMVSLLGGLGATWWQATQATRQAERADRVKDLVVGMFEASDPDIAQGTELSALDLLERGERTLLEGLEDEPEVRAELMQIVGSIYTSLGEYDRAGPLLESSLALREELGEEEDIVPALAALGDLRLGAGEYGRGEQLARRRLELQRGIDPAGSTEVATALTDLAGFLSAQARYDEAEALILEALGIERRAGAADLEADEWNSLSILRARQGDYDGAIEAGENSVGARLEVTSGDDTGLATSMANLAWALDNKGEYARADSFYAAALEMRRRLLGNEHAHVAIVLNNLGSMRQREGRLTESRELHEEALALRRRIFGDEHAEVAASLNNLGVVSYFEGDYAAAERAFREALPIFRAHREEDHPDVLTGVNNLAAVLREQGELDQSERLFRQTLETRTRVLGPEHQSTGGAWNNLGAILLLRGDPAGAADAHRRAIEIFRSALTPDHPDVANALWSLGRSLLDLGQNDEALQVLQEACPLYIERYGPDHNATAGCRGPLGLALLSAGQTTEAQIELAAAAPLLEAERPGDPWTSRVREALSRLSGS